MKPSPRFGAPLRGPWLERALRALLLGLGAWAAAFALGMYMRHPWSWALSAAPILLVALWPLSLCARIGLWIGDPVRYRGSLPGRSWTLPVSQIEEVELWEEGKEIRLAFCLAGGDQRMTEALDPRSLGELRAALEALGRPLCDSSFYRRRE